MGDSKSGSKSDLNESNMPLLEEEKEKTDKEQIEMEENEKEEDKDSKKKKKEKKEKKPKEPKEPKGPTKIDIMTTHLNLSDRDDKNINTEIDLGFNDVLAEPDTAQGFDAVWKLAYVVFTQTKLWLYRLVGAAVAIPAAIFWGVVFSFVTVFYVWCGSPAFRLFDFAIYCFRRVWNGLIHATVEPVTAALGAVFSRVKVDHNRSIVQDA